MRPARQLRPGWNERDGRLTASGNDDPLPVLNPVDELAEASLRLGDSNEMSC
jgi:hypothetical protein